MPPVLQNSIKAEESGDQVVPIGVTSFYTDFGRKEVVKFYAETFSRSYFLNLPLLTYQLTHPLERAKELLGEKQKATYVEEIIHPLKASLFISGYEWENDPFVPKIEMERNKIIVEGKVFKAKVTLYYQEAPVVVRLFVFLGTNLAALLVALAFKSIYDSFRHHR